MQLARVIRLSVNKSYQFIILEVCDTTRTSRATGHVLHHPIHVYRVLYHNYMISTLTVYACAYFAYISGTMKL